jgi:hypothetical protein
MKIEIEIEYRDGERGNDTVRIPPGTQIKTERHFSKKDEPFRLGSSEIAMEIIYWMAWHASATTAPFEAWWETIWGVDLSVDDGEDDSSDGPLVEGQPSGQSSQPLSNPVPASPTSS